MEKIELHYRINVMKKNSVRMSTATKVRGETMPDIYVPNDVLTELKWAPADTVVVIYSIAAK